MIVFSILAGIIMTIMVFCLILTIYDSYRKETYNINPNRKSINAMSVIVLGCIYIAFSYMATKDGDKSFLTEISTIGAIIGVVLSIKPIKKGTKSNAASIKEIEKSIDILDEKINTVSENISSLELMQRTTGSRASYEEVRKTLEYHRAILSKYCSLRDQLLAKKYQAEAQLDAESIGLTDIDIDRNLRDINKKLDAMDNMNKLNDKDDIVKKYL